MYFQKTYRLKLKYVFFYNYIKIKILIGIIFFMMFLYFGFSFLSKEKDDVTNLNSPLTISQNELGIGKNQFNFKEFSHSFWINISDLSDNMTDTSLNILEHLPTDVASDKFTISLVDGRKLAVYFENLDTSIDNIELQTPNTLYPDYSLIYDNFPLQTWVNVVVVKSITDLDLYIDSVLVKTMQVSQTFDVSSNIGNTVKLGDADWLNRATASITGYKYFVQALNQDEVSSVYKSLLSRFPNSGGRGNVGVSAGSEYSMEVNVDKNKQNILNAVF